jgi:thymidylate synthase (FAD)
MAHAGILQRSQRYVKESNVDFIDPPALAHCEYDDQLEWASIQDRAEALYLKMVDSKAMKKEDARYILPQGCSTEMHLCLNFQGWRDFLNNRAEKHAQWEVREVALEIKKQLSGIAPGIFGG